MLSTVQTSEEKERKVQTKMNYLEFAAGVAIILMALYMRYVAGLQAGWELIVFWVYWVVGLLLMKHARRKKKTKPSTPETSEDRQ